MEHHWKVLQHPHGMINNTARMGSNMYTCIQQSMKSAGQIHFTFEFRHTHTRTHTGTTMANLGHKRTDRGAQNVCWVCDWWLYGMLLKNYKYNQDMLTINVTGFPFYKTSNQTQSVTLTLVNLFPLHKNKHLVGDDFICLHFQPSLWFEREKHRKCHVTEVDLQWGRLFTYPADIKRLEDPSVRASFDFESWCLKRARWWREVVWCKPCTVKWHME